MGAADLCDLFCDWLTHEKLVASLSAGNEILIPAHLFSNFLVSTVISGRHVGVCERHERRHSKAGVY